MSREVYVLRDGELVPKSEAAPLHPVYGQGPVIHSDFSDPVRSMIDGKHYGSKRHYRDHVKSRGCEIVGNDFNKPVAHTIPDVPGLKDTIRRAYAGYED